MKTSIKTSLYIVAALGLWKTAQADTFLASPTILKALKPWGAEAGFSLRDSEGKEVVQSHGGGFFPPASVAKLISSSCALKILGPQYQFATELGYSGSIQNGVLSGDLILTGSGDPSLVIENLKEILEQLYVAIGIHEIKGSLVFRNRYLEKPSFELSEGFEGDAGRAFTANLTSIPLDFNSFSVWVSTRTGEPRAEVLPKSALDVKISNNIKIKGSRTDVALTYKPEAGTLTLSGEMPRDAEPKAIYRSLPNPYESFARLTTRIWRELGGVWASPKYLVVTDVAAYHSLFTHQSQPVSRLLMDINKLSTNFGAEMVLMAAAAKARGIPTSPAKAKLSLDDCLRNYQVDLKKIQMDNASGLSRNTQVQPSVFTYFLNRIRSEEFWPEFASTLSVLGRDGTTKSRLSSLAGRARLKTGSIEGVKTIAGYVFPKFDQPPLTFVLMFHCASGSCSSEKIIQTEDQILTALLP